MKCNLFVVEALSPNTGNWIFMKSFRTKKEAVGLANKIYTDTSIRVLAYVDWYDREFGDPGYLVYAILNERSFENE